jgi:signal transduction histidine kinase
MQRGQQHILGLLDQLLDYARIESGTIELATERIALNALVESAIELVRPQALATGARIVRRGHSVVAEADPDKARQILVNLLGNAIKFGRRDGTIEVTVGRDASHALVEVADDGQGVPADARERIFEPFVHLDDRTPGTGLGLPISRRLARAMDGDLALEPHSGTGARFTLRLPVARH